MRLRVGVRGAASSRRLSSLVGVLVVAVVACSGETADTISTSSTEPPPTTTTSTLPPDPAVDGPVFRVGLTAPITAANWWAAMDTAGTPSARAVFAHTKTALFELTRPGFAYVPVLADTDQPVLAEEEDSTWVVEQPIRDDISWSDGEPLTAGDLAFYFDVVREFELGGSHATAFPASVADVSAVDDYTLRVEFGAEPSLSDWQAGVAMMPFVPAHFWEDHVAAAREIAGSRGLDAGRSHLLSVETIDEPSSGALVFESLGDDAARSRSNPDYFARGTETTVYSDGSVRVAGPAGDEVYGGDASGEVVAHHVVGPFISGVEWRRYDGNDPAYEALVAGEIDFVVDPEGMSLSRYNELAGERDIELSVSPGDGFRFLAFNLRKPPMSDPVFREAVATVIDKDAVATSLFNGTLFPAHTVIHPDLTMFHNPEVELPGGWGSDSIPQGEKFETALEKLTEAGYTWDVEPELVYDADGSLVDVVGGEGLEMPNGVDVPALTIAAAPSSVEDPVRATYALWIGQWIADLGIPVTTEPTDLDSAAGTILEPETSEDVLSWDLHVLGWGAPNPALPGLSLVAFFHSSNRVEAGGLNATGYSSADFDAAAEEFLASRTMAEAARWTKEMEQIISAGLPYVTLYRPAVIEAHGSAVTFPVDAIMGGHGALPAAWPESVRIGR
ncbi:MAG: ABC transporter substrate-binding protein [Actinomycetota bacterium]